MLYPYALAEESLHVVSIPQNDGGEAHSRVKRSYGGVSVNQVDDSVDVGNALGVRANQRPLSILPLLIALAFAKTTLHPMLGTMKTVLRKIAGSWRSL